MENNNENQTPDTAKSGLSGFLFNDNPALKDLILKPAPNRSSWVNDQKIRRLYLQANAQTWFPPSKLNFDAPLNYDKDALRVWTRLNTIFYTLEKMGLNVIENMAAKAVSKLKSDEAALYLAVQASDEARHVFVIDAYLRKLGAPPQYDRKLHVLGQVASMGFYRVENWLFSTLFSENFASAFLRRARQAPIDTYGSEMCRHLLIDESRHLHFLHIVLPDIMDRLSLFGATYVKAAQFFIMKFAETVSSTLDEDAHIIGIDRRAIVEEAFENVEKAYEGFGVSRKWLWFPKIKVAKTMKLKASPTPH